MAWSKRKTKQEDARASGEGADWIHQTPVVDMLEKFREALKKDGLKGPNGDWPVIQLAHVAVMRAQPRKVAPLIVRLLQKREAEGTPAWNLDDTFLGAVGISMVRLLAAYLEDPAVPVGKARAAVDLFLRGIEPYPELKTVVPLMAMISAVRTETAPDGFQPGKRSSKLPLRTEMESSGMCAAAHRQWRVEYLLAMGAEDEALELAHRGRHDKPCGGTCAFAPHTMLAWLLEPLHRRGRNDEARVLEERLAALLTPRTLYLDAMGCRIHFLALEGRFDEAGKLLQVMLPISKDDMASPWQRLKFYEGCVRATEHAKTNGQLNTLFGDSDPPAESAERELTGLRENLRLSFAQRIS